MGEIRTVVEEHRFIHGKSYHQYTKTERKPQPNMFFQYKFNFPNVSVGIVFISPLVSMH